MRFLKDLVTALCMLVAVNGYTREELRQLPEETRFAANIQNNFIAGGFTKVLNWTSKTLGKPETSVLTQCTKPTYQGEKLCMRVPFPTPWSGYVDPEAPLPEYPRPQLRREEWLNLNGIWSFKSRGVRSMGGSWENEPEQRIVVPFPVEAPLSGIADHDVNNMEMQYKRNFTVPDAWEDQRVHLHFDAVDHTTNVYVNGHKVGYHEGGYDRFSFDITEYLHNGSNALAVHVFDPTEFAHIPIGKQRLHPPRHPSGIWYTSSSGIWQTVWLEPVPAAHIKRLQLVPDIDTGSISITVHGSKAGAGVRAEVTANGKNIATGEGTEGTAFKVQIPDPQLWSPDSPFLYDLQVSLDPNATAAHGAATAATSNSPAPSRRSRVDRNPTSRSLSSSGDASSSKGGDTVASYFALRKSSMGRTADGALRPMLNNEFVFQTGMLDQGFWPDGLYTPANDSALIFDLNFTKQLGFNMLRKHTKVESDRWYYHADRLGVLVWQDMPAMFYQAGPQDLSLADKMQFKVELQRIMQQQFNHPCIVVWVIFNEGWGQHDTLEVGSFAQELDSTRVFDVVSGWTDKEIGDLVDMHNYVGPGSPSPTATRGAVLGEFGGLGLRVEEHMWIPDDAFAYEMQLTGALLAERYVGLVAKVADLMVDGRFHLSAAVYTELCDVEAEINGWITYDRQVVKVDPEVLCKANQDLIAKSRTLGKSGNSTPAVPKINLRAAKSAERKTSRSRIAGTAQPAL